MLDKTCSRCRGVYPRDQFRDDTRYKDDKHPYCPDCRTDAYMLNNFNLSLVQYRELVEAQSGVCASCGNVSRDGRNLAIDHDRKCCPGRKSCGKCIRGLLCMSCNTALGHMQDDVDRIRKLAEYLEKTSHEIR